MLRLSAVPILFALSFAGLRAQTADWNDLKSIAPAGEVRVATSGCEFRGSLQNVTEDSIVLNSGSGQQTLRRQEVMRVSVRKKSHRKRNMLIGLAGGAGVGAGVGLASGCSGLCIVSKSQITAVTTMAGALIGTAVGAVIPTGGWGEIYKR